MKKQAASTRRRTSSSPRRSKSQKSFVTPNVTASRILSLTGEPLVYDQHTSPAKEYKSWAYNCASRNAVAVASSKMHLFTVRGTGEAYPKFAPYRRMKTHEQKWALSMVSKTVQRYIGAWYNGELIEITEHPILNMVHSANKQRNAFDFMEETSIFLDCSGNAYWYWTQGQGLESGIPTELHLLPSMWVQILTDTAGDVVGYRLTGKTKQIVLPPERVIHFRRPNPNNQYYGMGRIEAVFQEISNANELTLLEWDRARTRGIQDLWMQSKSGEPTYEQKNDFRFEFANQFNNTRRDPVPIITGTDWDVKNIAWSPRDLLALGSRAWTKECIINAFGQSLALWTENPNRANIEGAIYLWARFELDPTLIRIAEKINEQLLPAFELGDNRAFVAFESMTEDDRQFLLQQEASDIANHIRTPNEIRLARGLDESDDPRADELFIAPTAIPGSPFAGPPALSGEEEM